MAARKESAILRSIAMAICLAIALPLLGQAADGLDTRSDSTFKLLPGQDRFKVNVEVTLANRTPPETRVQACPSNPGMLCRVTTNYYYDRWGYLYVPAGATQLKIISPNVRSAVKEQTHHWTSYEVTFPNLHYGQTRKIRASYELPGEKPRSQHRTRIMDAYTYFCWHGEPGDRGVVTAELPSGYQATTYGGATRTRTSRKGTTITAATKGSPSRFYACTDAFKSSALVRTEIPGPSGQTVIVEGWPEDPEWSDRTSRFVQQTLPELEALMGRPLPFEQVTLREVSEQSLYGYGSQFGLRVAIIRLGEHIDNPSSAPRALASAWINERRIAETWLDHGLSDWAGYEAAGMSCWPASAYPGKGRPRLARWQSLDERPTDKLQALVDWQYDAACNIVEDVADVVGDDRMQAIIASLLDGTPKYGQQPADRVGGFRKATWKDWLDAADELGLVPAGETDLTVAERALTAAGVASARQLRGRAAARTAYHELLAAMGGTSMPRFVNELMARWRFETAMKELPRVSATYAAIVGNERMTEADRATLLADLETAESTRALLALQKAAAGFEPSAAEPGLPA